MFALTKNARTIKQLKKLIDADEELQHTQLTHLTDPTHRSMAEEKIRIERQKIALAFDSLKATLPSWEMIQSLNQLWKLDKPLYSEGTLFFATVSWGYNGDFYKFPYPAKYITQTYRMQQATKLGVVPFLRTALYEQTEKSIRQNGLEKFPGIQDPVLAMSCHDYIKYSIHPDNYTIFDHYPMAREKATLSYLAKSMYINIICLV